MADIYLRASNAPAVTCISNIFIDEHMKDANGEYVKIYLYLIRCLSQDGMEVSISAMADKLDHTEKDVRRALAYWEKAHLLQLEYDNNGEIVGICVLEPQISSEMSNAVQAIPAITVSIPAINAAAAPKPKSYTPEELQAFQQDDDFQEMMFISEKYLRRPLSKTDLDAILYWYDGMGLSADLIEYLVEYCVERGHTSIHYMEKVAQNWADNQITTVEEAKQSTGNHSQAYCRVMRSFGISGRSLAASERDYIEKWTNTYGFTLDIIEEACRRTINNIQKPSFKYTDSILDNWHRHNIHYVKDIERLDKEHAASERKEIPVTRNRFHNFNQREYDYDALEQQLLQQ